MTTSRDNLASYLNNPYIAVTGRVKTYVTKPEMETLPVSCTVLVPKFTNEDMEHTIKYISKALRTGAGINVHLDEFVSDPFNPRDLSSTPEIKFTANSKHPSYHTLKATVPFTDVVPQTSAYITVSDSMEVKGESWFPELLSAPERSIESSLYQAYLHGHYQCPVVFNLSALRPADVTNEQGMVSSGPVSFANMLTKAYEFGFYQDMETLLAFISVFNQELRRGGRYKNGAITTSLPLWHPDCERYLTLPKESHPWLKKGLVLPTDYLKFSSLLPLIYSKVNDGSLWLEKSVIQASGSGGYLWLRHDDKRMPNRLRSNVCREVLIPNRGTCNLSHANLGMCKTPAEIPTAMKSTMEFLCKLHQHAAQDSSGIYLSSQEDRQVGMGLLGLANHLAYQGVTYRDFVVSLDKAISYYTPTRIFEACQFPVQSLTPLPFMFTSSPLADEVAYYLIQGYVAAAQVAYQYKMERAFVIAPTASSSFKYTDHLGYTTTPEISPPISYEIERLSETVEESDVYFYPPECELASQVGFMWYRALVETIQRLMNSTGLAHSISFNIWEDIDEDFITWFAHSPVLTTYYRLTVTQDFLDKSNQFANNNPGVNGGIQCECAG